MILVSVLGDFYSSILPIFFNFKNEIDMHILVYDDFKRDVKRAREIMRGLANFKNKYNYSFRLKHYTVDEDSLESIKSCSKYILSQTKNPQHIYINTTDGFSTVNSILNHQLFEMGVNFIAYDMFDNEYNILNQHGIKKFKIKDNLKIVDHFLLKGYRTKSKDIKSFADRHEKSIGKLFEKHYKIYNQFLKLSPNKFPTIKSIPNSFKPIKNIFKNMNLQNRKKQDSLLTGGLFELYVYNLIKELNCDDVEIGLVVERFYDKTVIANEFDIFIMKNNHLNMIECKFLNHINKEGLVYKYIALSNILDEDGSIIIVTKKSNLSKNAISAVEKRGRMSNIYFKSIDYHNPSLFKSEVKSLFGL